MQKKLKLLLVCEMEGYDLTLEEMRERFDAFRESVQPSREYGITFYEALSKDLEDLD